ncbi:MAG: hypothetical protein MZW92_54685 [Comamonadaceae bacterium]|nr:hypothetical protein [Comamonadaceae bacterium]
MPRHCRSRRRRLLRRVAVRAASSRRRVLGAAPPARAVEPFVHRATSASRACSAPTRAPSSLRCRSASATRYDRRARASAALRALFATGLFKDVRIEIDGEVRGGHRRRAPDHRQRRASSA